MAGRHYVFQTDALSLSSGTTYYPLVITSALTTPILIKEIYAGFAGTSATAEQIKVEFVKLSGAATGGSALTAVTRDSDNSRSAVTTGVHSATGGTVSKTVWREHIHPQGKRTDNPGISANGAEVWAIRVVTGSANATGTFRIVIEE